MACRAHFHRKEKRKMYKPCVIDVDAIVAITMNVKQGLNIFNIEAAVLDVQGIDVMHDPCIDVGGLVGLLHHVVVWVDEMLVAVVVVIIGRQGIGGVDGDGGGGLGNGRWRRAGLGLGLVVMGGAADGEVVEDEVELGLGEVDLALEVADDAVAAADGVGGADVGLEDDGSHGLVLVGWVEVADDLGDVADAKQFMAVEELALAIVRKIRGENAVRGAFSTLVFASSASLGAVTNPWNAHWALLRFRRMI